MTNIISQYVLSDILRISTFFKIDSQVFLLFIGNLCFNPSSFCFYCSAKFVVWKAMVLGQTELAYRLQKTPRMQRKAAFGMFCLTTYYRLLPLQQTETTEIKAPKRIWPDLKSPGSNDSWAFSLFGAGNYYLLIGFNAAALNIACKKIHLLMSVNDA